MKTIHQDDVHRVRNLIIANQSITIKELVRLFNTLPEDALWVCSNESDGKSNIFIQSKEFEQLDEGSIAPQINIEFDVKTEKKVLITESTFNDLLAGL